MRQHILEDWAVLAEHLPDGDAAAAANDGKRWV